MSEPLNNLTRTIDDLEQRLEQSGGRIELARRIGEQLTGIVGRAETEDGHVRVEYAAGAVKELVINPRAMRMMAEDLSAAITDTIAAATADYQAQTLEALRASGVVPSADEQRREMDAAVAQLGNAQREFTTSLRSAAEVIGRASRTPRPTG